MELLRKYELELTISFECDAFRKRKLQNKEELLGEIDPICPYCFADPHTTSDKSNDPVYVLSIKGEKLDKQTLDMLIQSVKEYAKSDPSTRVNVVQRVTDEYSRIIDHPLMEGVFKKHQEDMIKYRELVSKFNSLAEELNLETRLTPDTEGYNDQNPYNLLIPKYQVPDECCVTVTETMIEPGMKIYMNPNSKILRLLDEWRWTKKYSCGAWFD